MAAAQMVLDRDPSGRMILRGESLGGGTRIDPVTLGDGGRLSRPTVLRIDLDPGRNEYRIASRDAATAEFTYHGTGETAMASRLGRLRLRVTGDFASGEDSVSIDRLELQSLGSDDG